MKKEKAYKEIHFEDKSQFPFYTISFEKGGVSRLSHHYHDEFEIIYFKKGKAMYEIDYLPYIVEGESILIMPKGAVHSARSIDYVMCSGEVFIFSDRLLEDSVRNLNITNYTLPLINGEMLFRVIDINKDKEVFDKMKEILIKVKELNIEKKYAYELRIKGLILEFFGILLQHGYSVCRVINKKQAEKNEKMKKVFQYIHENYAQNLMLSEVAKLVSLNTSYFSRYFKEYSGYNFNDYLNTYRITFATHMLFNTELSITDICFENGFQDLSYFIKVFKKKIGCSPLKFRQNNMKDR